jgi:hypothetical protein
MTAMGRKGGFSAEMVPFQGQNFLLEFGLRTREGEGEGCIRAKHLHPSLGTLLMAHRAGHTCSQFIHNVQ